MAYKVSYKVVAEQGQQLKNTAKDMENYIAQMNQIISKLGNDELLVTVREDLKKFIRQLEEEKIVLNLAGQIIADVIQSYTGTEKKNVQKVDRAKAHNRDFYKRPVAVASAGAAAAATATATANVTVNAGSGGEAAVTYSAPAAAAPAAAPAAAAVPAGGEAPASYTINSSNTYESTNIYMENPGGMSEAAPMASDIGFTAADITGGISEMGGAAASSGISAGAVAGTAAMAGLAAAGGGVAGVYMNRNKDDE